MLRTVTRTRAVCLLSAALVPLALLAAVVTGGAVLTLLLPVVALAVLAVGGAHVVWTGRRVQAIAAAAEDARELLPGVVALDGAGDAPAVPAVATDGRGGLARLARAVEALAVASVDVAGHQARRHASVAAAAEGVARRDQALVERQLALVDRMERAHLEPEARELLLGFAQLATRIRRHTESLLVLAGVGAGRVARRPLQVADAVHAAVAEVDGGGDVVLVSEVDPPLTAPVALEVAHLVAELLDVALTESADPGALVTVAPARDGVVLTVVGSGLDRSLADLPAAAAALAGTANVQDGAELGLVVAGLLARRVGCGVRLERTDSGATRAVVELPSPLFVPGAVAVAPAPASVEPVDVEPVDVEPVDVAEVEVEPEQVEPEQVEREQVEREQVEPEQVEPDVVPAAGTLADWVFDGATADADTVETPAADVTVPAAVAAETDGAPTEQLPGDLADLVAVASTREPGPVEPAVEERPDPAVDEVPEPAPAAGRAPTGQVDILPARAAGRARRFGRRRSGAAAATGSGARASARLAAVPSPTAPRSPAPAGAATPADSTLASSLFGASALAASPFGSSAGPAEAPRHDAAHGEGAPAQERASDGPFAASPFAASAFAASALAASPFADRSEAPAAHPQEAGAAEAGRDDASAPSPFAASPFAASPFAPSPFAPSPFAPSPFEEPPLTASGAAVTFADAPAPTEAPEPASASLIEAPADVDQRWPFGLPVPALAEPAGQSTMVQLAPEPSAGDMAADPHATAVEPALEAAVEPAAERNVAAGAPVAVPLAPPVPAPRSGSAPEPLTELLRQRSALASEALSELSRLSASPPSATAPASTTMRAGATAEPPRGAAGRRPAAVSDVRSMLSGTRGVTSGDGLGAEGQGKGGRR